MAERFIDAEYLKMHPDHIFVFGDNTIRQGYGGAAALRNFINSYGFVTKKYPGSYDSDFFKPAEYEKVFYQEIKKLVDVIKDNPDKKYLISRLGANLANKFGIYEKIIAPKIRKLLSGYPNVEFLWDEEDDLISEWWGYIDSLGRYFAFRYFSPFQLETAETNSFVARVFKPVKAKDSEEAISMFKKEVIHGTAEDINKD